MSAIIKANSIKSMEDLVYDMGLYVNNEIVNDWNRIFGKKIDDKITIKPDTEQKALYFELEGQTKSPIYYRSLGFRWFFCFLLFTRFRGKRKDNSKVLFLFDEPASNLHSTAQKRLLNSFEKIVKDGCSLIYSTHSHYMINPKWIENSYIIENEALNIDDKNSESEYTFDAQRHISVVATKYKQFVQKNPTKTTYYQPVLDVLDYKPAELEFNSDVKIMEGKTDYFAMRYFIDVIFKDDVEHKSFKALKIVPSMNGASGMDTLIELYLGWGYDFKIILDADPKKGGGKDSKKRYIDTYMLKENQLICLDDIDSNWKNYSLENLFDEDDLLNFQKSEFPKNLKYDKKIFHNALMIKLRKNELFTFSETTKANFKKILTSVKGLSPKHQ